MISTEEMSRDMAQIERGVITEETAEGFRVQSYGRAGLITPPIPAGEGGGFTPVVGEKVYFFLFGDGTGQIIGRF